MATPVPSDVLILDGAHTPMAEYNGAFAEISEPVQKVVTGAIIVAAVALDRTRLEKSP